MLLEALIAILVFSFGVLGMVAINARSVQAAADAEYRAEAARLADEIAGQIALEVDRGANNTSPPLVAAAIAADLPNFAHRATTTGACNFTGDASAEAAVTNWVVKAQALPGVARTTVVVAGSDDDQSAGRCQGSGQFAVLAAGQAFQSFTTYQHNPPTRLPATVQHRLTMPPPQTSQTCCSLPNALFRAQTY